MRSTSERNGLVCVFNEGSIPGVLPEMEVLPAILGVICTSFSWAAPRMLQPSRNNDQQTTAKAELEVSRRLGRLQIGEPMATSAGQRSYSFRCYFPNDSYP